MITRLIWTSLSTAQERPLNLITHSYLALMITSMRGCHLWPWPISSMLFICDIAYFMDYIHMWRKYNPWRDDVTYHFSVKGQGHTGRSNFYSLVDYWSTISSYCWRKDCFWPSMNVCIYCLNVPCCEILFNQNYLRYYIFFKIWPWKVGPTSYRLASISFFVSQHSHSWDMAISKSDLENPRSRPGLRSKFKVIQLA